MKRYVLILALLLVAGLILFPMKGMGQMRPGMMGPGGGYRGWYCPYCGQYMGPGGGYGMGSGMMGPGMMGPGMMGRGMMGPGMMHRGWGMGPQYGPQYQQPQRPLAEKDVKGILENHLISTRNPNLKLGKVTEKDTHFEAEIVTKDNSLADKIIVDKYSGWMRSIY